ncbi:MAG: biosynthetic-type acetolactate synthase large subunit [Candidatus Pacearchaeota archaeon]
MSINENNNIKKKDLPKNRSGAEIFVDTINDLKIDYIFGHTGGAIMPMYVEINKRISRHEKTPEVIMFRQEPGAGHAAEGYSKIKGKPLLVCATSGPGATNLVTPIADCFADSIPAIFVTGQVSSNYLGTNAFQEVPITKIVSPITKLAILVKNANEIESALRKAYDISLSGRKGPVLIDICKDAFNGKNNEEPLINSSIEKKIEDKFDKKVIDEMLKQFAKAKKPIIYIGGGIKIDDSYELLKTFAKKYDSPVGMTLMSLGSIPRDNKLSLGMLGMHGTIEANNAAKNSDFILGIGVRFDDRVAVKDFGNHAKICHVDIDASEINKIRKVDYEINTSAKRFLEYAINNGPSRTEDLNDWHNQISEWKKMNPKLDEEKDEIIPQIFIKELSNLTSGKSIIATGVGQHQMWTAQYYNFINPTDFLTSGGLGTMGYGLPAAIGAYFTKSNKEIILIDGDGSFQMNMQELGTVVQNKIPLKMFVINNGLWGLPMQWHEMFDEGNLFECCLERDLTCPKNCSSFKTCKKRNNNPDLINLDKVYPGLKTARITRPEEMIPMIKEVLAHKGPYLVDVQIKKESYILPIIPPGKGIDDIITEY